MMKETIRNKMIDDPFIMELVQPENIRFYKWTDETRTSYPFVLIVPTAPPLSGTHASNDELTKILTYDIHVQAGTSLVTKNLMIHIHKMMKQMKFSQLPGGVDDYFEDTRKYVQARRYRINTKLYDNDY